MTLPEVPVEDMDGDILELLQCLEPAVQIEAVEQFDVQGVLGHVCRWVLCRRGTMVC